MESQRVYAEPKRGHVSLGGSLRMILFLVPVLLVGLILYVGPVRQGGAIGFAGVVAGVIFAVLWGILISGIRVAAQWERGVVLRLGKFQTVKG
nr:slipin family protein [bacterium]